MATISTPTGREAAWTDRLESVRKDVERCFGHLKKRFQILRLPSSVISFAQIVCLLRLSQAFVRTNGAVSGRGVG